MYKFNFDDRFFGNINQNKKNYLKLKIVDILKELSEEELGYFLDIIKYSQRTQDY
ncbi:MAG: hypothetical protein HOC71_09025 [Candidatus Latescibacteria bacterium]|nr:hypothetical protein [Candidatus Latescibacterota bacterium]